MNTSTAIPFTMRLTTQMRAGGMASCEGGWKFVMAPLKNGVSYVMIPGTTQMHLWLVTKLDSPAMVCAVIRYVFCHVIKPVAS